MTHTPRVATFLAPTMLPIDAFIVDHIGRALGHRTELVVGTSFDEFGNGEVDAGFICGLPYTPRHDMRDTCLSSGVAERGSGSIP